MWKADRLIGRGEERVRMKKLCKECGNEINNSYANPGHRPGV
jgi:hypothetical protein